MKPEHLYKTKITWTGNNGTGTSDYTDYERNYTLSVDNKQDVFCSSDPAFRGDGTKLNPEELLVSALSSCHMLWYLHFCADNGITVTDYTDHAVGRMIENEGGGGHFVEVVLNPVVTILEEKLIEKANLMHKEANKKCFIANSCNFPVKHSPRCITREKE